MTTPNSPFARKLRAYVALTADEISALDALYKRRRNVDAGQNLIHEGQSGHMAFILAKGWTCSYKLLHNGARQIIAFQIPGDVVGLHNLLRTSSHSFAAITDIEVSEFSAVHLSNLFGRMPHFVEAVLWAASRDEAMVVEHLVDIGRRSALVRTAHFLLELGARLKLVGMASSSGYNCPLSQYLLADALGLSAIHINRVLRQLREMNLLSFRKGKVTFDNFEALTKLAEFDAAYLDQTGPLLQRDLSWSVTGRVRLVSP